MEPEVDVPLAAQAKWRGAVREESKRRRRSRLVRWIGSAAAAVVVLVGVGLALNLNGAPKQGADVALVAAEKAAPMGKMEEESADAAVSEAAEEAAYEDAAVFEAAEEVAYEDAAASGTRAYAAPNALMAAPKAAYEAEESYDAAMGAVVESDGAAMDQGAIQVNGDLEEAEEAEEADMCESAEESASAAATAMRAPAWELSMQVESVETACGRIRDLVEEYEGSADVQQLAEGGANVYVELPANNAADFLSAVLPLDVSGQARALPEFAGEGEVQLLLALR